MKLKINFDEQKQFAEILGWYIAKKLKTVGSAIEKFKNGVVDLLLYKRGRFSKVFLHGGMVFIIAGVLASAPILASNYPILGIESSRIKLTQASSSVLNTETAEISTVASEKPRDTVITHRVESDQTLSAIARDYGVTMDSIKWLNQNVEDFENLAIGLELKIPPVSGMIHQVVSGDTVYSIAETYRTNAQKIVDFPFNKFANDETFELVAGQDLVVPDGQPPEPVYQPPPVEIYAHYGTPVAGGSGQFQWPTTGMISQWFNWYHTGLDIADSSAPAVSAAEGGRVVLVEYLDWGYGRHVIIDHGNGYQTLYGHLQEIYVSTDPDRNTVSRGQAIGKMGSTGRSTGTHLHFEVRYNGVFQDPLGYLK